MDHLPTFGGLPADMLLMLGKLDGKLDGIQSTLAAMTSRADGHEVRIVSLEQWRAEEGGAEKQNKVLGNAGKVFLGALIPVVLWAVNYLVS